MITGIVIEKDGNKVFLTEDEVKCIVNEWYLNGMTPDIFQDEDGNDLEEYLDVEFSLKLKTIRNEL